MARFKILGLVGEGREGRVYRADDVVLGRKVALKVLFEGVATPSALQHARMLAAIEHEHVVKIHELTTVDDPVSKEQTEALVMELIEGPPLADLVAHGVSFATCREVIDGLLSGIGAIHARGLAHGDLHDENVLVKNGAQPVILDPQLTTKVQMTAVEAHQLGDIRNVRRLVLSVLRACPPLSGGLTMRTARKRLEAAGTVEDLKRLVDLFFERDFESPDMFVLRRTAEGHETVVIGHDGEPNQTIEGVVLGTPNGTWRLQESTRPCLVAAGLRVLWGEEEVQGETMDIAVFHLVDPAGERLPIELEPLARWDFTGDFVDVVRWLRPIAVTPERLCYSIGVYFNSGGAHGVTQCRFRHLDLSTMTLAPLPDFDAIEFTADERAEIEEQFEKAGADYPSAEPEVVARYRTFDEEGGMHDKLHCTTSATYAASDRVWDDYTVSAFLLRDTEDSLDEDVRSKLRATTGAGELIGWTIGRKPEPFRNGQDNEELFLEDLLMSPDR